LEHLFRAVRADYPAPVFDPRQRGKPGAAGAVQDKLSPLKTILAQPTYQVSYPDVVGRPGDKLVIDISDAVEIVQSSRQSMTSASSWPSAERL
jgi:hypothetical protein